MDRILADIPDAVSWNTLAWGVGLFLGSVLISMLVIGVLLVNLPATFFLDSHSREFWEDRHPALKWTARIAKNLLGLLVIAFGVLLSLPGVPGQGLLTILVGIILLDFPGKRRLERAIVSRRAIRRRIDQLRAKFGKRPLVLDEPVLIRDERGEDDGVERQEGVDEGI